MNTAFFCQNNGKICKGFFLLCLLVGLCAAPFAAKAQQSKPRVTVTGTVTDTGGCPVPGASVVLHGTTIGISTDANGKFRLEFEERPNIIIDVSFIGMKKQEIPVKLRGGKADIKVILESDTNIEEVVVTGIFTRKKEGYTGSVSTIKGEDIKKYSHDEYRQGDQCRGTEFPYHGQFRDGVRTPMRCPTCACAGTSTLPGGAASGDGLISLQGEYDTYPNQPLLLLDGFEIDVQTMADLDPDRVASITILKDASATAIYGSKASNGVIVIETLAPKPGTINVTYSGNVRVEMPDLSSYNLMNSAEKIYVEKLAGLYAENDLDAQRDYQSRLREVKRGVDTYWLSKPLRTSVQHRHALTLEGGSNELRYKLYAGLNETPGVMKGSKRSTQTVSLDLSYRFKKFLLKNSVTADNAVGTESPYGSFSDYASLNPYLRPYDENGNINKIMQTWNMSYSGGAGNRYEVANPLYNTTFHSLDRDTDFTVRNLFKLEYRPSEAWILQGNVSISKNTAKPRFSVRAITRLSTT